MRECVHTVQSISNTKKTREQVRRETRGAKNKQQTPPIASHLAQPAERGEEFAVFRRLLEGDDVVAGDGHQPPPAILEYRVVAPQALQSRRLRVARLIFQALIHRVNEFVAHERGRRRGGGRGGGFDVTADVVVRGDHAGGGGAESLEVLLLGHLHLEIYCLVVFF